MNTKINLSICLLTIVFLSAFATSAQKVSYHLAPGADLSRYKTYQWQKADDAKYPEKAIDDMFVRSIDAELSRRGYVRSENDGADMIVIYQIAILDDMLWSAGKSTIPFLGN